MTETINLLWWVDATTYERDWIHELLKRANVNFNDIFDETKSKVVENALIVCNSLITGQAKFSEYVNANMPFAIIHVSDEYLDDTYSLYNHSLCKFVFRQYTHPMLLRHEKLAGTLALGYKNDFWTGYIGPTPDLITYADRPYKWSFSGYTLKQDRELILSLFTQFQPHFIYRSGLFNSPDNMPTAEYRDTLIKSLFVLCPIGNNSLDTYRLYEALEAGSIPVTVRANFNQAFVRYMPTDYWTTVFGVPNESIPFLNGVWSENVVRMEALLSDPQAYEALRKRCLRFWANYKERMAESIGKAVKLITGDRNEISVSPDVQEKLALDQEKLDQEKTDQELKKKEALEKEILEKLHIEEIEKQKQIEKELLEKIKIPPKNPIILQLETNAEDFVASPSFVGSCSLYVFKADWLGIGYYRDGLLPPPKGKLVAFLSPKLSVADVPLYDYAHYNEKLLGNRSIILTVSDTDEQYLSVYKYFADRFKVITYEHGEINAIVEREKVDVLYVMKTGYNDGFHATKCKTAVHAIQDLSDPHGSIYSAVSEYQNKKFGTDYPVVPIIVSVADVKEDLRAQLNIPLDAFVFASFGSVIDVPYIQSIVKAVATGSVVRRPYFLFMDTPPFVTGLSNVIFVQSTLDQKLKKMIINTCDAMLYGRSSGEIFGREVGEFAICGKPVIAAAQAYDKNHLEMIDCIKHSTPAQLTDILTNWTKWRQTVDVTKNGYLNFSPERVMDVFSRVFLG